MQPNTLLSTLLFVLYLSFSGFSPAFIHSASAQNPLSAVEAFFSGTSPAGNSPLYQGRPQLPYEHGLRNHPYFISQVPVTGELTYNGVLYTGVDMLLDIFRDELLVRHPDTGHNIVLETARFQRALVHGYEVVYLSGAGRNAPEGYILLLNDGDIKAYWKPVVNIEQMPDPDGIVSTFLPRDRFYILMEGKYTEVKNQNALLKMFVENRRDIERMLKERNLSFKNNPAETLAAVVKYNEEIER